MNNKIAEINYPKFKKVKKTEIGVLYQFELNDKKIEIGYKIFSDYLFLELNYKNELILRKTNNIILFYENCDLDKSREFRYDKKIISCYTLSNNNYLLSTLDNNNKHYLLLLSKELKIVKEQQVGLTSWHSQNSIDENNGVIMYSEYNVAKVSTKVSIFRSLDMGLTWSEVIFKYSPDEIRHWHTLQADMEHKNHWLATSGDTPEQSRWFLTKNNGNSWSEITDKNFINQTVPSKSLSAHRTTHIEDDKDTYYWATDDLMGSPKEYFTVVDGARKASSKFYKSEKSEPIKIEKLANLGIHIRSMINVKDGFLFFTEGKYVSYNAQIFYIDKSDLTNAYFLMSLPSNESHGGTYSMSSQLNENNKFYQLNRVHEKLLTLEFTFNTLTNNNDNFAYNLDNYIKLEEHLWFVNKTATISNIIFSNNCVNLKLNNKKDTFYMLLGDYKMDRLLAKELFKLNDEKKLIKISVSIKIKNSSSVKMYIQFFDDNEKVSSKSLNLKNGINNIDIQKKENEKYIKLLFRVESNQEDEIELYDLNLQYKENTSSLIITSSDTAGMESISDDKGHKLKYRLNLQNNPMGLPLLVVLHGHESTATKFRHEGWNVLAPLDNFGYKNSGAWWLGENGDFFLRDLLQRLINEVSEKYDCKNNIYIYGSSMGGYGAILHGILANARAIYANVPQIQFYGSTYFKLNLIENAKSIFDMQESLPIENDLVEVLEKYKDKTLPIFFLCENTIQDSRVFKNYLQEHTMKFANKCIELQKKCHIELLPQSGHTKNYGLKEVLMKFEKFAPPSKGIMCTLKDKFTLTDKNWFENKREKSNKVLFNNNTIECNLYFSSNSIPFYLVSGSSSTSSMDENSKKYKILLCDKLSFEIDVDYNNDCSFKFYILQFDDSKKIDTKSFTLKNGNNKIVYSRDKEAKYLKVAFRVDTNETKNVYLKINKFQFGLDEVKKDKNLSFEIVDYGKNSDITFFNPIIKFDNYVQHTLQLNKLKIDMLSHYKKNSDKLIVFFNGAVDVNKTPPPVFQRWTWLEKLPYSTLIVSDPTINELQKIYDDKTLIGWYQGEENHFILESILMHIKSIASKLNISNENILFYGSSAGGFAALYSVNSIKGSKACVVNPQTNIMEYFAQHKDRLVKHLNFEKSTNNINIISLLKDKEALPQVYYKQNRLDEMHYKKHYLPFKEIYEKSNDNQNLYTVIIEDDRGHSAIPSFDEAKQDIEKTFEIFLPNIANNVEFKQLMLKETLDLELFTLVNNKSTLDRFIPRKDIPAYKLEFPLDWSIDPYQDRNWCYQLHAWRMIDHRFFVYEKDKNISILTECLPIIEDWEKYTIFENKETDMTWNDMATGLRALKLGYLINRLFTKDIGHSILDSDRSMLIRMAELHIKELRKQKISLNNHGIFQVHGLIVLAWLFLDKESIDYALMCMKKLINQQFYPEGFHSENSDDYHWFIYKTFDDIMRFDPYKSDSGIQEIMQKANSCKLWTVFPNNQSLLIGDSSDSIRKIINKPLDDKNKIIIKHFKDSGYLFIRSSFQTEVEKSSMLFLQTAYKSKTHRHADDFNVLLYEYGMNILVDSGKYAYENNNSNRIYTISTRAHNCVQIDNKDYEFKGKFLYESALKYAKFEDKIYKIKTSLERKDIDVLHERNIIYLPSKFCIVIDMLVSKKKRDYDQFWHFHQDLELKEEGNFYITDINKTVSMKIEPTIVNLDKFNIKLDNDTKNIKLIKGQIEPELQGWRSLKYKEMIENYALQNSIKAKKALLITKFVFNDENSKENDLDITISKGGGKISCNIVSILLDIDLKIVL